MQPGANIAPIREVWSRATCRVSWSNHLSSIFRDLDKKGYRQGPGSGNLGESLVKATISQRQYGYQNHRKITYKKTNFLCVYPLPVLRPDLDSSQDSRKVSQGIFQKIPKLTKLQRGKDLCPLDSNDYIDEFRDQGLVTYSAVSVNTRSVVDRVDAGLPIHRQIYRSGDRPVIRGYSFEHPGLYGAQVYSRCCFGPNI